MAFSPAKRMAGWAPQRIERRNSRTRSITSATPSRTTTFSPVTRVNTVSGAASTNLMRSELIASRELFKRVNWIICILQPGEA